MCPDQFFLLRGMHCCLNPIYCSCGLLFHCFYECLGIKENCQQRFPYCAYLAADDEQDPYFDQQRMICSALVAKAYVHMKIFPAVLEIADKELNQGLKWQLKDADTETGDSWFQKFEWSTVMPMDFVVGVPHPDKQIHKRGVR
jgi:hypothetical protein